MSDKYEERKAGAFVRDPDTGVLRPDLSTDQTVESGPRRAPRDEADKQPAKSKQKKGD